MFQDLFKIGVKGHVKMTEHYKDGTSKVLVDKDNAVHPQNMARIIARGLSHEANSYIWRMALGDGGTTWSSDGSIIYKSPNTGSDGSGWESRLYNETYSEIVDGTSTLVGTDPGSSDANSVRPGGGAVPTDDPTPDSVVSQEVGTKSNVIITMYINGNEPVTQVSSMTDETTSSAEEDFDFNEMGLYSHGKQARDTSGYSSVNVGGKTSSDASTLAVSTAYNINLSVDGTSYSAVIKTPASGTGDSGNLTYGDICEGINTGDWIQSGDPLQNYIYVYITDDSNGTYPTILSKQSYGYLNFQSKTSGTSSSVNLVCTSGDSSDFFSTLVSSICGNVNYVVVAGDTAGVANDAVDPDDERERLLTHIIFAPIRKSAGSTIVIVYTLTVSVNPTVSSVVNEVSSPTS